MIRNEMIRNGNIYIYIFISYEMNIYIYHGLNESGK